MQVVQRQFFNVSTEWHLSASARNTVAFQEQEREVQEMRRHLGACVHVRLTIENIWVSQGKVLMWVRLDVKYLYSI